jgi:hypothetical protein
LLAQSFSGPSPLGLATIFYCLRYETSLFVASCDSQGHGGGIRPRFHTGFLASLIGKAKSRFGRLGFRNAIEVTVTNETLSKKILAFRSETIVKYEVVSALH